MVIIVIFDESFSSFVTLVHCKVSFVTSLLIELARQNHSLAIYIVSAAQYKYRQQTIAGAIVFTALVLFGCYNGSSGTYMVLYSYAWEPT